MLIQPEANHYLMYCRLRTEDDKEWEKVTSVSVDWVLVQEMPPGEMYHFKLNTVRDGVEIDEQQVVTHTVSEYFALCCGK
jgi:hypothetical protein